MPKTAGRNIELENDKYLAQYVLLRKSSFDVLMVARIDYIQDIIGLYIKRASDESVVT